MSTSVKVASINTSIWNQFITKLKKKSLKSKTISLQQNKVVLSLLNVSEIILGKHSALAILCPL